MHRGIGSPCLQQIQQDCNIQLRSRAHARCTEQGQVCQRAGVPLRGADTRAAKRTNTIAIAVSFMMSRVFLFTLVQLRLCNISWTIARPCMQLWKEQASGVTKGWWKAHKRYDISVTRHKTKNKTKTKKNKRNNYLLFSTVKIKHDLNGLILLEMVCVRKKIPLQCKNTLTAELALCLRPPPNTLGFSFLLKLFTALLDLPHTWKGISRSQGGGMNSGCCH